MPKRLFSLYDTKEDKMIGEKMSIKEIAEYVKGTKNYVSESFDKGRLLRKRYKMEEIFDDRPNTSVSTNDFIKFSNEWNFARARILKACGRDTSHIRYAFCWKNWEAGKTK